MENKDVRLYAKGADIPLWRIADFLKVSESTLTRLLRKPLEKSQKDKLLNAIDAIRKETAS